MDNLDWGSRAVDRLAGFASFLHANGFSTGGGDSLQVLDVAQRLGVLDADHLRMGLQATLCSRADEWRRFPALFDAWFLPANRWQRPVRREAVGASPAGASAPRPQGPNTAKDDPGIRPPRVASQADSLASADFATLTAREHMADIEALIRAFARRLKPWRVRREAPAQRGRRLDLPATIRRSIESGGTPLELAWRDRRVVRPRLVLLIDVSRSMSDYSFFYLRLARAMAAELHDVHSFIFHTGLTGVSRALADPDPWRAQEKLHLLAQGWGGGTRIGDCLARFAADHAPRLLHSRSAVIVFSDGYDTGEPAVLAQAMARLRRRARRIVWLNPLASQAGYAPVSPGMQAAMPYLDLFAPAANLASLQATMPRVLDALRGGS